MPSRNPFHAVVGLFLVEAVAFSSWLPRLPEIKAALDLRDGTFGFVLVGMPAGALVAMPLAGALLGQLDLRRLNLSFMGWLVATTLLIPLASSAVMLTFVLFLVGVGTGSMGVAMNAAGISVEKDTGKAILSRCHAFFSVAVQLLVVASGLAILLLAIRPGLPQHRPAPSSEPRFALPTGALLVPATIAFICLLAEGATLDWSSIYLASGFKDPMLIGGGVVAFGAAMAVARFAGDWLFVRFGGRTVVSCGAGLSAVGFTLASIAPHPLVAIIAFAVSGLGLAGIIPIAFRTAGNTSGLESGVAVAAVSSVGYLGFLVGPPLMGFVAETLSLAAAFLLLALGMGAIAALTAGLTDRATSSNGVQP